MEFGAQGLDGVTHLAYVGAHFGAQGLDGVTYLAYVGAHFGAQGLYLDTHGLDAAVRTAVRREYDEKDRSHDGSDRYH